MIYLSLALIVLGALAWDGWRRWVHVRAMRLDERLAAIDVALREHEHPAMTGHEGRLGAVEEKVRDLSIKLAHGGRR